MTVKVKLEKNLFNNETHQKIVDFVKSQAYLITETDTDKFKRLGAHNTPFFVHIHKQLTDFASELFGEKVKTSYTYLSIYGNEGICPLHTDRPQCKYTIDYCIDQDKEWEIYVDDKSYILQPNDALCYSGTDSPHYRNKIEGQYAWLSFFHFVPVDFNGSLL